MKHNTKIISLFFALIISSANIAFAGNPNDLISIKTDPVLKDPRGMISIKTDPVLNPRSELLKGYNNNFQSILDLIGAFEKSGAKVSTNIIENNGITVLEVTVNGNKTTPFVLKCLDCEVIVYEY
jgi:hypothetical protein